jgi:prevent-host-death family protein
MITVGVFEAKTHFSDLIVKVENGEEIVVTKHGKPVAKLVSYEPKEPKISVEQAIRDIRELRKRLKGSMSLEEALSLRHEGHKY